MSKIWIGVGVAVVAGGVALAAALGVFDRSAPVVPGSPGTATAPGGVANPEITADDRVLGQPDAPVTILEYASLTCPHCADFHKRTMPQLRSEFIDTGKVKLVFRDFPLDQVALAASAMARCMPVERYFPMLSVLFDAQMSWATAPDPLAALVRIGKTGGLSEEEARRCATDEAELDKVAAQRLAGQQAYDIRSTPSFVIGGRTYGGALTIDELRDILKPLVP